VRWLQAGAFLLALPARSDADCPAFAPPDTVFRGLGAWGLATADFDRDERVDLAVTARAANVFAVLRGNGDGTFEEIVRAPAGTDPRSIVTGDLDGDGILDLVVANSTLTSDSLQVFYGGGKSGTWDGSFFRVGRGGVGLEPTGLALANLDEDAFPDLLVTSRSDDRLLVFLGTGTRDPDAGLAFAGSVATSTRPGSVAVADLDADGIFDCITTDSDSDLVSVFRGGGSLGTWDGTFEPAVPYPVQVTPTFVVVEDLDGDDILDAAVPNATSNTVSILLGESAGGTATGTFRPAVHYFTGDSVHTSPRHLVAADFTGDGVLDLVTPNAHTDNVSVLLGNGTPPGDGTYQAPRNFPLGQFPRQAATADFDRDGRLDLAISDDFDGTLVVLLNRCDLVPVLLEGLSASRERGGVRVTGLLTGELDCARVRLYREAPGAPRVLADDRSCDGFHSGAIDLFDETPPPRRVRYVVVEVDASGNERTLGALWVEAPRRPAPMRPNPTGGAVHLPASAIGAGVARVRVYDAIGRCMTNHVVTVGDELVRVWDGTDRMGMPAPSGSYIVVIERDGMQRTFAARLVR